jgi:salicylate hydroxylase
MSAIPINGGKTLSVSAYVSDRSAPPDQREWNRYSWVVPGSVDQMLLEFEQFGEDAKKLLKVLFHCPIQGAGLTEFTACQEA